MCLCLTLRSGRTLSAKQGGLQARQRQEQRRPGGHTQKLAQGPRAPGTSMQRKNEGQADKQPFL